MRHTALSFVALVCFSALAQAAAPTADELKALGGQVKETAGAVTELSFKDCSKLGEAEFKLIGQATTLKKLTLYGSCHGLTDATLPLLAGLTNLEELGTDGVKLSDDGFKGFAAFVNLRSLAFFHPSWAFKEFTGAGLAHLKTLEKLERLTFAGSTAGDDALAAVGQLTQLHEFRTWHTAQTQKGNEQLLKLMKLTGIHLGQRLPPYGKECPASFDDSTLAILAQIPTLESVSVSEARLSAAGLTKLKALPKLKAVKIEQTDISAADVEAVRAALPGVKIDFKPLSDKDKDELIGKKLKL
jgi:hypothetical protein